MVRSRDPNDDPKKELKRVERQLADAEARQRESLGLIVHAAQALARLRSHVRANDFDRFLEREL